jgi:DNA-binding transcriptional ArsR family regulator
MSPGPTVADNLAVLADPTRRALLELLREKPQRVGDLAARLPVSGPAVSQHLKALQKARVVRDEWRGTSHYFSLDPEGFEAIRRYLDVMWRDALSSFAAFVEHETSAAATRTPRRSRKQP